MNGVAIRPERNGDERAVSQIIARAFAGNSHSNGDEAQIIERLRSALDLEAAYVAQTRWGRIVGQVAFSMVRIDGRECDWYGLGPIAVEPKRQGQGIGSALVETGLAALRELAAAGCVVLGDPGFYARFGFAPDPDLVFPGPPPENFMSLKMAGPPARGVVSYAPAFG